MRPRFLLLTLILLSTLPACTKQGATKADVEAAFRAAGTNASWRSVEVLEMGDVVDEGETRQLQAVRVKLDYVETVPLTHRTRSCSGTTEVKVVREKGGIDGWGPWKAPPFMYWRGISCGRFH